MRNHRWVILLIVLIAVALGLNIAADQVKKTLINLPTSKLLIAPAPGDPQPTNNFPTSIRLTPDGRYAVMLEMGYGTMDSGVRQGIAVLDLKTNKLAEFFDDRLAKSARQTYFVGLAIGSDGNHLYASMGSITDPLGKKPASTGNGIAVYQFSDGKVTPERFIPIPPQQLAEGKKAGRISREAPNGAAVPFPAGIAIVGTDQGDNLLVADNLSDDVLLLDPKTGNILHRFDLSTSQDVPA